MHASPGHPNSCSVSARSLLSSRECALGVRVEHFQLGRPDAKRRAARKTMNRDEMGRWRRPLGAIASGPALPRQGNAEIHWPSTAFLARRLIAALPARTRLGSWAGHHALTSCARRDESNSVVFGSPCGVRGSGSRYSDPSRASAAVSLLMRATHPRSWPQRCVLGLRLSTHEPGWCICVRSAVWGVH